MHACMHAGRLYIFTATQKKEGKRGEGKETNSKEADFRNPDLMIMHYLCTYLMWIPELYGILHN